MKRYKIIHNTTYDFGDRVQLLAHTLRLRPREGHELRIEGSVLNFSPPATLRWHRDEEGNCVAIATFSENTQRLTIESESIIQQYDQAPHDFLIADYAVNYPFSYGNEEAVVLAPYMNQASASDNIAVHSWVRGLLAPNEAIQSFALLLRLNQRIYQSLNYRTREEEGVQSATQTLNNGSGSCRDYACLFIDAARLLGFAARFVSGYVYSAATTSQSGQSGSTHAWLEVFIPGAGWKGFDPTVGKLVGQEHFAVAVARFPESVPPVSGSFLGAPGAKMTVSVWVDELY